MVTVTLDIRWGDAVLPTRVPLSAAPLCASSAKAAGEALDEALREEEYESAAELRDFIKRCHGSI